jgi:phage tail-like protein
VPAATANGQHKLFYPTCYFVVTVPDIDTIGMFFACSGLEVEMECLEYTQGGNNEVIHHLPTRLHYPKLYLSRGLTAEDALTKWFDATKTKAELKEVTIKQQDHKKAVIRSWTFADAFPTKWIGPSFDAEASGLATESIEICHGGLKAV